MRSYFKGAAAAVLLFSTTACLDLNVINENNPDIDRALGDPADVEQVIASSFPIFMSTFNTSDMTFVYPQLADEMTSTLTIRGGVQFSEEPRFPLDNDPQASSVWIPRRPWDNYSECVANTNDGLRQIDRGMVIRTIDPGADAVSDNTTRAYVFAKLMQGMCLGYLALTMDQVAVATEDTPVPAGYDDQRDWERTNLKNPSQMLAVAINSLEEAITRASTPDTFATPASWINQQQYYNWDIIELAHTLIARFMVYTPRTPDERRLVDWDKVLYHTERGLTYNFGPVLESGIMTQGNWLGYITATSSELRADPLYLGQADISGQFEAWLDKPVDDRTAYFIISPDRRVVGPPLLTCTTTDPANFTISTLAANAGSRSDRCTPNGAYFRNRNTVANFNAARGTQHQSLYQWFRRSNYGGFISSTGHYTIASVAENVSFRAEALIRLNRVEEAIPLINWSRTRAVKLGTNENAPNMLPEIPLTNDVNTLVPNPPHAVVYGPAAAPVTVTYENGCVPRSHVDPSQCGNIWDALIWERKMELMGQDNIRAWADFRGLGMLQPGTLYHMPIPGRYLVSLNMPIYTHGGIGGTGAAQ
jgi:hypothetical protein